MGPGPWMLSSLAVVLRGRICACHCSREGRGTSSRASADRIAGGSGSERVGLRL
jgi:hypothetical protein